MGGARSSRRDFPSFWEGLSLRLQVIGLGNRFVIQHFPSFWEGLSLRQRESRQLPHWRALFPFLLGRAFIEAISKFPGGAYEAEFPFLLGRAFIEAFRFWNIWGGGGKFPFLLGRAFIEAVTAHTAPKPQHSFPFLSGGAFIEASSPPTKDNTMGTNFPSYWGGLSLRRHAGLHLGDAVSGISLPFRRDFH